MEKIVVNITGTVRQDKIGSTDYLVAPVSLIVPGVLNGSRGPLFYSLEETSKNPSAWDHMPIVVYHPEAAGLPVSARDPDVLNKQGIGIVLRSRIANGKLVAEGWFDTARTRQVDSRVLENLESRKPIELSTGISLDPVPAPEGSTHNGVGYDFVARNYRPDHLAILPDQIGACSLKDGCGVLVNVLVNNEIVAGNLPLSEVTLMLDSPQDNCCLSRENTAFDLTRIINVLSGGE